MSNNKKSNDHIPDVGKKVSSIDWLYNKMYEHRGNITIEEYEQAKAIHKEEKYQSWCKGREKLIEENPLRNNGEIVSCADFYKDSKKNFEEWYNETFTEKT